MDTSGLNFTEREEEIIARVTLTVQGEVLAMLADVEKLEGGEQSTLRLTVDGAASTDLDREHIANSSLSIAELSAEVIEDLQRQGVAQRTQE